MKASWHGNTWFNVLLALSDRSSSLTGGFPFQRVNDAELYCLFFDSLNKLLNKQWSYRWFETPWRSYDVTAMEIQFFPLCLKWCEDPGNEFPDKWFMNQNTCCLYKSLLMASQITSLTIVYSTVHSGADQRKHQSSASLAFVRWIHRWSVNSPHKWPVTRKMFPFDDVIMFLSAFVLQSKLTVQDRHIEEYCSASNVCCLEYDRITVMARLFHNPLAQPKRQALGWG